MRSLFNLCESQRIFYQRTHRLIRCFDSKGAKRRGTLDFRIFSTRTMSGMSCLLEAHDENDRQSTSVFVGFLIGNYSYKMNTLLFGGTIGTLYDWA